MKVINIQNVSIHREGNNTYSLYVTDYDIEKFVASGYGYQSSEEISKAADFLRVYGSLVFVNNYTLPINVEDRVAGDYYIYKNNDGTLNAVRFNEDSTYNDLSLVQDSQSRLYAIDSCLYVWNGAYLVPFEDFVYRIYQKQSESSISKELIEYISSFVSIKLSDYVTKNDVNKLVQNISETYVSNQQLQVYIQNVLKDAQKFTPTTDNNDIRMDQTIGGFTSGTTLKQLKDMDMTLSDMFVELLFPVSEPKITLPSITQSLYTTYYYGYTIPKFTDFTQVFSYGKGSVVPQNNAQIWSTYSTSINERINGVDYTNGISMTQTKETATIYGALRYGGGGNVYDNRGNKCGTLENKTITKQVNITKVKPVFWYCYTNNQQQDVEWVSNTTDEIEIYADDSYKYKAYNVNCAFFKNQKNPKFYIYNSLSRVWEAEEEGVWKRKGVIYYTAENNEPHVSNITSSISYELWERDMGSIKNTQPYKIKIEF